MRWFSLLMLPWTLPVSLKAADAQFENRIAQVETETGSRIGVAAIDSGTGRRIVGDKTGRSGKGATNDVAVLYPANGARVFIAIYSVAPSGSEEKRSEIVASVAREAVVGLRTPEKD